MDSSKTNQIDAAFEKGKERVDFDLYNKYITDAEFCYLLTKETHKVANLLLRTCCHI